MSKTFGMVGGGPGGGSGGGATLSSIAITRPPSKTVYRPNETFDPAGMVVTATYSNGATLAVGGYVVTPQIMTLGTTFVTVTYAEGGVSRSVTQAVTINTFQAFISILSPAGSTITCTGGGETQSITSTGEDKIAVYTSGTYTLKRVKDGKSAERSISVTQSGSTVTAVLSWRYGYRKTKAESEPSARISYLYDAVGMTPAAMNFSTGVFDYGGWGDVWFVKKNRPVMLKYDRTVDYELNHSDQTKKLNGTASDISSTSYAGNAMSEIPLGWVYRYEDATYEYEIVCEHQWDSNYKAYAHTRADGSVADAFYWSMFGGSGSTSKIRSIADQTTVANLTAQNEIAGAQANGNGWYTHTWSQREYIRTLLVLMGKSTDTQSVYGIGNSKDNPINVGSSDILKTGTLKNKGQFWGSNKLLQQVKVFYIERFWGDQYDRTAGIISDKGPIYYKMTPEGAGYQIDNVNGYTNSGVTLAETNGGFISKMKCGEFGCIPSERIETNKGGSGSRYECDFVYTNGTGQLTYLLTGSAVNGGVGYCGAFSFHVNLKPSDKAWNACCGLSAEMPKK